MSLPESSPLFASQWYLKNNGQRGAPGVDINVVPVWKDYTGKGVLVAVNDDGMDLSHPDLAANIALDLVFDTARLTTGQGFVGTDNSHGTVVGSVIGMVNNDIGGVGVAYDVRLAPAWAFGGTSANLFGSNLAIGAAISVNSWGSDPAFAENFSATNGSAADQAWGAAMLKAVTEGRNGLGMVIEVSGGNQRETNADAAMSNFTGARYTIAVGAMDNLGKVTDYSTAGAALLVSAPGGVADEAGQSVNTAYGIVSADISGEKGYNTNAGAAGDYAYQNQGTSYSGPMVAGVAALMLQANPKLGFRDVSNILALTARQVDASNASWVHAAGSSWNMDGMHFSRDYGFGLVDATAAVHLAESWNMAAATAANWRSVQGAAQAQPTQIPESTDGIAVGIVVSQNIGIERIEVDLELDASAPSQLKATLTSPGGTTVTLFDQPMTRSVVNGALDMSVPETAWPGVFTIGATAFLGETSSGTWTLRLFDKVTGTVATYQSATVRAWGSDLGNDSNLVFTDEFSGVRTLTDNAGSDTVNGAALSAALMIDLGAGAKSTLGRGELTIASGSVIENAIGGSGADTILGNEVANLLRGNRGDDTLDGKGGLDMAQFTGARANYTIVKTSTGFSVTDKAGSEGVDLLAGIERLSFSDTLYALDVDPSGTGGQAFRIYQAAFNRTPDAGGLGYWLGVMDHGVALTDIASGFIGSAEFKTVYGAAPTNRDLVTKFYENILHRAPEQAGFDFWFGVLESNAAPLAQVLASISESNENQVGLVGVIGNGFAYMPFTG